MPVASTTRHVSSLPPPRARYVLCGNPAAEARVVQDLARVSTFVDSEMGDAMRALVLVGAFARAEGGIIERDGEPYAAAPGYELLALFKHRASHRQGRLDALARNWTQLLQARVNLRAFPLAGLADPPATRFWFHAGRRQLITLVGDPTIVGVIPRLEAQALRADEAAFALCEGLSGLACATLDPRASEQERVDRMQRAILLYGDALLTRRGQYADALRGRAEALDAICASAVLSSGYRDAIMYIARPDLFPMQGGAATEWLETTRHWLLRVHLHAEAERARTPRELLGYVHHLGPLSGNEAPGAERRLLSEVLHALPIRRAEFARLLSPLERLLRASTALAFAPYVREARTAAATLLRLSWTGRDSILDDALLRGLRALARDVLGDPTRDPFCDFTGCSP